MTVIVTLLSIIAASYIRLLLPLLLHIELLLRLRHDGLMGEVVVVVVGVIVLHCR